MLKCRLAEFALVWLQLLTLTLLLGQNCSADTLDQMQSKQERYLFPASLADTLDTPEREQWQQPSRVIEALGVKSGDHVADIGAGGGYFTFSLADKVGDNGKVYAVDVQQEMLDFIQARIKKNSVTNILLMKSTQSSSNLPAACCDKMLMVNTWHELSGPAAFMENLRSSLKPGGTVAIINWKQLEKFKQFNEPGVIEEMKLAGFTLSESYNFLERQYFLIFSVTK